VPAEAVVVQGFGTYHLVEKHFIDLGGRVVRRLISRSPAS
jgi:hypothetical protein